MTFDLGFMVIPPEVSYILVGYGMGMISTLIGFVVYKVGR